MCVDRKLVPVEAKHKDASHLHKQRSKAESRLEMLQEASFTHGSWRPEIVIAPKQS
jgi:hypothetical protein